MRALFDSDVCPVGDELLGSLYRASADGLPELVNSVSPDVRAMLALFCYRRHHLHSLGLAIAATCSERDLINHGGIAGATLYAQSRRHATVALPDSSRRTITLPSQPLAAAVHDIDDGDDDADPAAMAGEATA